MGLIVPKVRTLFEQDDWGFFQEEAKNWPGIKIWMDYHHAACELSTEKEMNECFHKWVMETGKFLGAEIFARLLTDIEAVQSRAQFDHLFRYTAMRYKKRGQASNVDQSTAEESRLGEPGQDGSEGASLDVTQTPARLLH